MRHPMDGNSYFEKPRYSAVFQRVSPSSHVAPEPIPPISHDIYDAFTAFVQHRPAEFGAHDEHSRHRSEAWDYLGSLGFHPQEVQKLRFGVYSSPEDVRSVLRSDGFSDAAILESGLVTDARGAFRDDWRGSLIVPLEDENGRICDVLAVIRENGSARREFALGPARSEIAAYGLKTAFVTSAGRQNLVLVEDIMEAFYLQCRGFTNVAAVGGDGREFSSKRWENLARLDVEAVTLAFGNDRTRQRDVREALDHALRAPSAPEVFVLERTQLLENETLADVARRHGLEACQKAAAVKSLAFHGKHFGWSWKREPVRQNGHKALVGFPRDNRPGELWTESERIAHPYERAAVQQTIAEVNEALDHRQYDHARSVLDSRLTHPWRQTAPEEIRSANVDAILDSLCKQKSPNAVPEQFRDYDGNELQKNTVTVLANESRRGRLADLCSRLVTALETQTDQTFVVVCREFSEEVVTLGLIAQMTRRMTTAQGLTFEEIQARLSGRDPEAGYGDKPWLVDEAVDRLRRWADRLRFLTGAADLSNAGWFVERIADSQTLGGVFFDSVPAVWNRDFPRSLNGSDPVSPIETLRELADRLSCAVVLVTDRTFASEQTVPANQITPTRGFDSAGPAVREFRKRIADWIEQAQREEIRVA